MGEGPLRVWIGTAPEADFGDRADRLSLVPIVRAALDVGGDPEARSQRYGPLLTDYELCGPDEAEIALVPRSIASGDDPSVRTFVDEAEQRGLRTMIFGSRDLEPIVRSAAAIVVHPGPTRGAQPSADVLASPYMHTDRWSGPMQRTDDDRPSVAFCGQGAQRPGMGAVHVARRAFDLVRGGRAPAVVNAPVRGHVGLRSRALRVLRDHPGVDDRFVIRDRYRSGGGGGDARARAEQDFDDNLRSATYALCVRGTGNFSARFYEALSFGRIPLFVDTRCVLPFEDEIDWPSHAVMVGSGSVDDLADRLVHEHQGGTDGPRSADALRALWKDRLSQEGFFAHLPAAVRRLG